MNKIRTYITLCLALLAWAMPARGERLDFPLDTINGQVYYRYKVERSVGLYRISVKFGVTQEEILKANPHLQKQGLRFEEVILIPAKEVKDAVSERSNKEEEVKGKRIEAKSAVNDQNNKEEEVKDEGATLLLHDSPLLLHDSTRMLHDTTPVLVDSIVTRVAILLPLHADAIKRDKNMERFYDFYAGALIAIYEAQARGQQLEIFTYDIGKTANRTKEILQQHPEIHQMDAIIGPAYSQQVNIVLDSIRGDSIWCLIPFLSRVDNTKQYPYMMKFNPSEHIEADTIARYLAQRADSINCVLIEAKEGENIPSGIKALHEALKTHEVPTTTVTLRAILNDSISESFRSDLENIVIFNTERYTNLQTVMPHLLKACSDYRITLYSHYSWQTEKIFLPQLYASVFAQRPSIPEAYEALWTMYFDHELSSLHPRYDLLGYDLTSQLLHAIRHSEGHMLIDGGIWKGAQADIHYQQSTLHSGYENHIVHIIHQ